MAAVRKRSIQATDSPPDMRDEFLDLAGHELRAPITALKGQMQLLQRRLRAQPGREGDVAELNKMMYQLERLNHELDIYLDAMHVSRDQFELTPIECDIVAIANRIVAIYATGATGHNIRLEASEEHLIGIWDRKRLDEAISAMLSNAVKYGSNGDIVVRIFRDTRGARVEVLDRGIGVPVVDRHRIFAPYIQGSNVKNAGVGLGLAVAREAIRRHHGRIGIRARAGGGSIFWFVVPVGPPSTTTAPLPPRTARLAGKTPGNQRKATIAPD